MDLQPQRPASLPDSAVFKYTLKADDLPSPESSQLACELQIGDEVWWWGNAVDGGGIAYARNGEVIGQLYIRPCGLVAERREPRTEVEIHESAVAGQRGGHRSERVVPRVIRFLVRCGLRGLLWGLVGAVAAGAFFGCAEYGATRPIAPDPLRGAMFGSVLGFVIGFLFGIGNVFIQTFSDPNAAAIGRSDDAVDVAAEFVEPVLPDGAGLVMSAFIWLTRTDFSKQRPNRWKRALAGALCGVAIGAMLATVGYLVTTPTPHSLTLWQGMLIFPVAGATLLGIVGAVSDTW